MNGGPSPGTEFGCIFSALFMPHSAAVLAFAAWGPMEWSIMQSWSLGLGHNYHYFCVTDPQNHIINVYAAAHTLTRNTHFIWGLPSQYEYLQIGSVLTPSTPAVPNCRCSKGSAPYWSNLSFLIFWHSDTLTLSPERQSARMSKIKNGGLDRYDKV